MTKQNKPSEKNFGLTFGVIFLAISFYLFYKDPQLNSLFLTFLLFGLSFLVFSFLKPKVFFIPNLIWFYFGIFLQKIFTPVILFILFFIGIGLTSIYYKIFVKKEINNAKNKGNWIKALSIEKKINYDNQF